MREWVTVIAVLLVAISAAVPVYVYLTYPSNEEPERVLERDFLPPMPIKPPRFIVGSVRYSWSEGVEVIGTPSLKRLDDYLVVLLPTRRPGLLVFAQSYVEQRSQRLVLGEEVVNFVKAGNATLVVEILRTHRGVVCIVLEVHVGTEKYVAVHWG